jgi:hypothetical protein
MSQSAVQGDGSVPIGARCAVHQGEAGLVACVRCGTFACVTCVAPDGVRCVTCAARSPRLRWRSNLALSAPHAFVLWLFLRFELESQTELIDSCTTRRLDAVPGWLRSVVLDGPLREVLPLSVTLFIVLDNVLADRRGPRAWGVQSRGIEFGGAGVLLVVSAFFLAERFMYGNVLPPGPHAITPVVLGALISCSVAANRGFRWAQVACRLLPFIAGAGLLLLAPKAIVPGMDLMGSDTWSGELYEWLFSDFMGPFVVLGVVLLPFIAAVECKTRHQTQVTVQFVLMMVWLGVSVLQLKLYALNFSLACIGPELSSGGPASAMVIGAFVVATVLRIVRRDRWFW